MTWTMPVPDTVSPPESPTPPPAAPPAPHSRVGRLRGRPDDALWVRPALLALLIATAALYLWGLGASGWANSFYSAAVQAGSVSWKAFFFGSSDASNFITVDKTPASLWVMALSARLVGVNAWSILVPQALEGVAAVGVLYLTVRRWFGPAAGLLAGAVLACTPVAALMFRFNNPDALLVLLLVAGAYAVVRALQSGSTKWLMLAGGFVGFGFLAKMLQALLVVPVFALVYLVAGPPKLGKRIGQVLLAGLALVVSAGWYVAVVELVPASMRPYIGGSQDNSLLGLALGYNGLGRLNGNETGSVGGGNSRGGTGWTRMFDAAQGGQISWLLPAALVLLVAGLVVTARAPRTDRTRAGFLLWGGWLVVTGVVFSFMQGIFHAYYTVALAPAVGALVGMGAVTLWRARRQPAAAATLAATVAVSAWWAYVLLGRTSDWHPWLKWVVLAGGLAAAVALLGSFRLPARVAGLAAGVALVAVLAGPAAYAANTASTPHSGAIPSAGPNVARGDGGGGPGGKGPGGGGQPGGFPGGGAPRGGGGQPGGLPGGGFPGGGTRGGGMPGGGTTSRGGSQGGGMNGLLNGSTPSDQTVALLKANASSYTWVAATVRSNSASGYQLASGEPVMAIGGFNGSDPTPTLTQFQQYVAQGKIHYFIGGSDGMRSAGGSDYSQQITDWVTANFTATTVGNTTMYDLTTG
jgi:4-amino-4-deoxy-L-arabinose transferase-like glycosyltransferase